MQRIWWHLCTAATIVPVLWVIAWWAMWLAWPALAHDSYAWIMEGKYRNPTTGELCCGERDCFMLRPEQVRVTAQGYELSFGLTAGVEGPIQQEVVPFAEAQP